MKGQMSKDKHKNDGMWINKILKGLNRRQKVR